MELLGRHAKNNGRVRRKEVARFRAFGAVLAVLSVRVCLLWCYLTGVIRVRAFPSSFKKKCVSRGRQKKEEGQSSILTSIPWLVITTNYFTWKR
jgi:hypothetical protein